MAALISNYGSFKSVAGALVRNKEGKYCLVFAQGDFGYLGRLIPPAEQVQSGDGSGMAKQ